MRSYLSANGLSVVDSTDMSLVVSGTAAAADQAFGVGLRTYTDARGITYQAPSRNVRLPKGIASVVQSVAGLDSSLKLHPHYQVAKHVRPTAGAARSASCRHSVTGCNAAQTQADATPGGLPATGPRSRDGLQPRRAGQRRNDGTGQIIGFVEFSNYNRRREPLQELLHGHHRARLTTDATIGGGPSDHFGQVEVNLDIEVAMGAAPDASLKVYKAANNLALLPTMLHQMRTDGVDVVSDSWGLCELFVPVKLTADENTALELLAVSNASFYVASGDDGSRRLPRGQPGREVPRDRRSVGPAVRDRRRRDEPADRAVRGRVEKAWKGSGGGISINWPKPGYQRGGRTPDVPGGFCSSGTAQCRVTPDIAMDAAPQTGYIIRSHGLGGGSARGLEHRRRHERRRAAHGRITADANESAGGANLGFANPFIYQEAEQRFPRHHSRATTPTAPARASRPGPGSTWSRDADRLIANNFATAFAGFTPPVLSFDTTKLTATHPTNMKRVKKGAVVTFEGVLTNVTGAHPIANRQIIVIGNGGIIGVDRTGTSGKWEIRFKVKKRTSWHAVFMGSAAEKPDLSPTLTVRIQH